jgi:class 3 adenylate cyclase/tetratricopeptide (TPR) repeat protein
MSDSLGHLSNAAPGAARNVAGERRVITVLFCDVVGSTSLAARFDPEEWAEVMNEVFQYMIAPIEEYGGMVARLMGDAVLAFFGAPQAHEDDPQRAVLAGLGIIHGIRIFARQFQQDYGWEFNVRVGINTGPVVVGEMGGQMGEYTAMGDAINLAARMEQTAEAGTVQISEDTYRLVAPLFDIVDLGGIEVKGKEDPVHAYRVLGMELQPGQLRGLAGVRSPLIGRERELGRLRDIVAGLREGRSAICYLIGEAGLGKSRLVTELRREWRDPATSSDPHWRGWSEFVAVSYGAGHPYDMLKRQLRNFCSIRETDPPAIIHERLDTIISAYPSALHQRMHSVFGFLLGDAQPGGPFAQGEVFQRELRAVLEQMTQVQTAHGPAVFVIDDAHWADVASLEMLRNLLLLVVQRPVLFLFAMRPDWNTPAWQLYLEAQVEYADYCASVYLEPLTTADSHALIRELLENARAPERIYELVERKAEGNPFFVEETVRTLIDSGALRRDVEGLCWQPEADVDRIADLIGLPGNVQALLTARIDQLEADTRRTLQLAAVIGRSFPLSVLERIAERSPAVLEEHLKRLAQADLVRPALSGVEAEYAFRHALTRDAAYETILIRRRRRDHRRVGEAFESLYADRLADEAPRLAYHFSEARDWSKAARYYALAGEAAAKLYANTEAIDHYRRALDIALANTTAVDDHTLVDLCRRLGRVYEVAGRYDDALRLYESLERLGTERDNPTLQLEGLMPQATVYLTPTPHMSADRGCGLAERILTLAERTARPDAEAFGRWALQLFYVNVRPDPARAVSEGERALALARENGLRELEAFIINDIGRAYAAVGRGDDAFAAFEQAYTHWRALGNEPMMADALSVWSQGLWLRGDLAAAERASREGLAIGQRIGGLWAQAFSSYPLGVVLLDRGHLSEAIALLHSTATLAARAGFQGLGAIMAVVLRWLMGWLGLPGYRLDEWEALLTAEGDDPTLWAYWQALDRYHAGDGAAAYELVAAVETPILSYAGHEGIFRVTLVPELALAAGQPVEAFAAADSALEALRGSGFRAMWADVLTLRGRALAAQGRAEEALADWRAAYDEATRQGARRAEWGALVALAAAEPDPAVAADYRRRAVEATRLLADHLDEPALRAAFLNQPEVRLIMEKQD